MAGLVDSVLNLINKQPKDADLPYCLQSTHGMVAN
jgi:hypothetical protein